ncbi:PAS domain protein [anaerobic digester metagenome]
MYRVLYVDDEPALLEIGRLYLETSEQLGVETRISAAEGLAALAGGRFDAVISDFQMPGMDGIGFLKEVRHRFGQVPFVLFTGRGREEVAIAAINNGVDFYIQKGGEPSVQYAELEHGVLQAIHRREAEERLRRSEERYRSVVDDQVELIARFTHDGTITFANRAFRAHVEGFRGPGEVVGQKINDVIWAADPAGLPSFLSSLSPGSPIRVHELTALGRDGRMHHVLFSVRALFGDNGQAEEYQVVGRDVTAEWEAEQALRLREARLRFMLGFYERAGQSEHALLAYAIEGSGIVTESPLGYLAFLNEDESELVMHAWSRTAMEMCATRTKSLVYRTTSTGLWGEPVRQRRPVITNDYAAPNPKKRGYPEGHPPIRRHMSVPVMEGDRVVMVAGVANKEVDYTENDVSELSLLMQGLWQVLKGKRAEASLRESEERYRLVSECSGHLVYDLDIESGAIRWSGPVERVTGETPEAFQAVGIAGWEARIHPDDRARVTTALEDAIARGDDFWVEYRFRRADGTYIPVEDLGAFITDAEGRARRMVGTMNDLSGRRQVEEALRQSEERYRGITERIRDLVFVLDRNFNLSYISPSFEMISGASAAPFLGGPLPLDRLRPEDRVRIAEAMERSRALEPTGPLEVVYRAGDGRSLVLEFHGTPIVEDGHLAGVQLIAHDITGLREAQERLREANEGLAEREEELREQLERLVRRERQLRESEARFRAIFDHAPVALTLSDVHGKLCLAANPAFERITGVPVEEAIGKGAAEMGLVNPDISDSLSQEIASRGGVDNLPITFERVGGEAREGLLSAIPILLEDRPAVLTLVVDVTEQNRAVELVRESERRLRSFFDSMAEAVFITDEEGRIIEWNPAAERISGLGRNEAIGMPSGEMSFRCLPSERRTERERARLEEVVQNVFRSGEAPFLGPREIEVERADGTRIIVRQTVFLIPTTRGVRIGSVALEITDQVRAAEALRASEERFRRLVERIPLGIALVGTDFRFQEVNPAFSRMLGYPGEELIGREFSSITHPDDIPVGLAETRRLLAREIPFFQLEKRYLARDGRVVWGLVTVFPILDDQGRVTLLIPVIEDITERRLAENALRTANRQLGLLASITRHDIRNNVMVMLGYLSLAQDQTPDPVQLAVLERLKATTRRIQEQIEFTGLFEHLGSRDPEWQPLAGIVSDLRVPVGVVLAGETGGFEVFADLMLGHVFSNLLDNSVRHGGPAVSRVHVGADETDEGLVVVFEDDGTGIPEEEKEAVFERGVGKHTGLGLFLAREILALTGITIRETGVPGRGARFELVVPPGAFRSGDGD